MLPIKEVTGKKPMPGKFECFDDPDVYDKFLLEQKEKNARMAEKRAKIVNSKMAREKWLKEKITKAEKDMKESVALVEKLRSARAIQKHRSLGTSYTSVDPGSGRHDSGRQSQKWQDLCPPDLQTPADCDEIDHIPVRGPSRQEDEINSQKSTCLRIGSSDYGTTEKQTKTQSTRHQQTSKSSDVTLQPRRRSSQEMIHDQ